MFLLMEAEWRVDRRRLTAEERSKERVEFAEQSRESDCKTGNEKVPVRMFCSL